MQEKSNSNKHIVGNSDKVPNVSDGNSPERRKKWLLIVSGSLLVVSILAGTWLLWHNGGNGDRQDRSSAQEPSSALSYEDCISDNNSAFDQDGGVCTTSDGIVFYLGDDFSENEDSEGNPASALTEVVGDQSVKLVIGDPSPAFLWGSPYLITYGSSNMTLPVEVVATNVDIDTCKLKIDSVPDKPGDAPVHISKVPLASESFTFIDGRHTVSIECPTKSGTPIKITKVFGVADRRPEACLDYNFSEPATTSVSTVSELRAALNGTWQGCADLPSSWAAPYYMTLAFNQDGRYNASSEEELDGQVFDGGFYTYNVASENPSKVFDITAFSGGVGSGFLDVIRKESNVVQRAELRNVKIDGSNLSFDFHLTSGSKAIHFKLTRQ